MDKLIAEASYYEEYAKGQEQLLVSLYHNTIDSVERHVESLRNSYI